MTKSHQTLGEMIANLCDISTFGAVQKSTHLVDLKTAPKIKNEYQ